MERRGNSQNHGALGTELRGNLHRAFHRTGVAGDDRLLRRIQICRGTNLAFRRALAGICHHGWRQTHDGSHRAHTGRNRILHIRPALAHELHGIRKFQRPGSHQGRIFTQAVPRHEIRHQALLRQHANHGDRTRQNRRLGVRRQLEVLFRAREAHLRNRETQRLVGLAKNGSRCRILFRQLFAHTRVLRSLPRKHECDFAHR